MLMLLWRKCVSLLTSAALFLAMLTPPAVQHAHVGGDASHSHAASGRHHRHDADAAHHHHGDAHRHTDHGTPVAHRHVSLLFVDFSLPLQDDDDSDSDSLPLLLPVVCCGESWHMPTSGHAPSSLSAVVAEPVAVPHVSIEGDGERPRAGNRLCDSARGARTGVLLI